MLASSGVVGVAPHSERNFWVNGGSRSQPPSYVTAGLGLAESNVANLLAVVTDVGLPLASLHPSPAREAALNPTCLLLQDLLPSPGFA